MTGFCISCLSTKYANKIIELFTNVVLSVLKFVCAALDFVILNQKIKNGDLAQLKGIP